MPQPGPQTLPRPQPWAPPPPAHSPPTSPPPEPRGLWDPTRAGLGAAAGGQAAHSGGDSQRRRRPLPAPASGPQQPAHRPPEQEQEHCCSAGMAGGGQGRGSETHRPRSSVSGTLPPADVQPGGHSEDLHLNELGTDRTRGRWPRAWPRRAVLLAVTLGGRRRWGGQQDRRTQPVLGTDGEAQGGAPSSPARPGPPSVPKYGLPRGTFHHASSSPGSSYRTPKEGGFLSSITGLP